MHRLTKLLTQGDIQGFMGELSMAPIWEKLLDVGAICGLVSLLYLFAQNLRRKPRFSFDFASQSGVLDSDDEHYTITFSGQLKNKSLDPNTVTNIHLVVWANQKRNSYLRFGSAGLKVIESATDLELPVPIAFGPRDSKSLNISFRFRPQGTSDESLISATVPLPNNSQYQINKYQYELCVEDINDILFDQKGIPRNREELGLRWTLQNATKELQHGKFSPFVSHYFRIVKSGARFRMKMLLFTLGLWK